MSAKNVVLAQRNGNGVDVVLPRTSADLTGYENADAPGVETVAEALDDIYARSPGNIAALAGRVDVLETGQVEQNEDIAALESGVADWTASKPGIVQRVEVLEAKPDPTPESIGAAKAKHAAQHATGGSDAVTPDSIGAAQKIHTHTFADISGTLSPSQGGTGVNSLQALAAQLKGTGVFGGVARLVGEFYFHPDPLDISISGLTPGHLLLWIALGYQKNNSSSNGPLPQMALGQIPGSRDNGNNPPSTGLLTGLTGANKYTKDSVVFSVVGMASSTTENHIRNMDMAIILEPTVNVRAYRIQQAWPMYIQFYEL